MMKEHSNIFRNCSEEKQLLSKIPDEPAKMKLYFDILCKNRSTKVCLKLWFETIKQSITDLNNFIISRVSLIVIFRLLLQIATYGFERFFVFCCFDGFSYRNSQFHHTEKKIFFLNCSWPKLKFYPLQHREWSLMTSASRGEGGEGGDCRLCGRHKRTSFNQKSKS